MSKRLIRISSANIYTTLQHLPKIEISAVTDRGNTVFGRIASIQPDGLTLTDGRSHQHYLAFKDLYEVVYDVAQV